MSDPVHIEDFEIVNDMVDAAARKIWRKSYHICLYVFGAFEDVTQVGWAALCAKKSARAIISKPADGQQGLIQTIAYRGMIDYIRSVIGRQDTENCARKLKLFRTTYYMDYFMKSDPNGMITNHDEMLDYIMPKAETETPESLTMAAALQSEIDNFLNKKLNRKDKMIMDYMYKMDLSQREIGEKFSMTESRVSQIKKKAIQQARDKFANTEAT